MMNIPIIGIIENMSYVECPDCKKHIEIFGKSHVDEVAAEYNLPVLGKIPMTPAIAAASDAGDIESLDGDWFATAIPAIEAASKAYKITNQKIKNAQKRSDMHSTRYHSSFNIIRF